MRFAPSLAVGCALLAAGCATPPPAIPPPAAERQPPAAAVRPADLPFPDYLFPEGYEIGEYGRIPETRRMAAEFTTTETLGQVLDRYSDLLVAKGWSIGKMEALDQSIRMTATAANAWLELRAVRGTGSTHVFLMYEPVGKGSVP